MGAREGPPEKEVPAATAADGHNRKSGLAKPINQQQPKAPPRQCGRFAEDDR